MGMGIIYAIRVLEVYSIIIIVFMFGRAFFGEEQKVVKIISYVVKPYTNAFKVFKINTSYGYLDLSCLVGSLVLRYLFIPALVSTLCVTGTFTC